MSRGTPKREALVTVEEAAIRQGVSPETIRRRIVSGELPVFMDNQDRRRRLIALRDLDRVFRPTRLTVAA